MALVSRELSVNLSGDLEQPAVVAVDRDNQSSWFLRDSIAAVPGSWSKWPGQSLE